MQHIEEAGIHSGDSACVIPPHTLPVDVILEIKEQTRKLAAALNVKGLMNIQFAVSGLRTDGSLGTATPVVYILEANPRASRTIPFVSKATGVPLARLAALVMAGKTLDELGVTDRPAPSHYSVKESVFPFNKFPGVDILLGPEMRSTGEVMGVGENFGEAFAKAQLSAGTPLPDKGRLFVSVNDRDKPAAVALARRFAELGFEIAATRGTAEAIRAAGLAVKVIFKVNEGRPNAVDLLKAGSLNLIVYTGTTGAHAFADEKAIRRNAVTHRIPCITTISGARAAVEAIASRRRDPIRVWSLQEIHARGAKGVA
jgi:carbamoyl-phosphate synthase large subunit